MKQPQVVPDKMQKYKRKALRRPLIVLRARLENDRKSFFGYAKNISRGGMFISSVNPYDPGSRFKVEFPLPEPCRNIVACQCEVVWKRNFEPRGRHEPGMGLRFTDIPDDQADVIDAWVHSEG